MAPKGLHSTIEGPYRCRCRYRRIDSITTPLAVLAPDSVPQKGIDEMNPMQMFCRWMCTLMGGCPMMGGMM
ncbi:hypothetical protein ACQPZ2_22235 [Nocardia pseudovaccinii]|uniref:hypothetical protein n=1 Tax=Nocardia pseudovaccinii TaxID=189540 RepID=UPI003D8AA05B